MDREDVRVRLLRLKLKPWERREQLLARLAYFNTLRLDANSVACFVVINSAIFELFILLTEF